MCDLRPYPALGHIDKTAKNDEEDHRPQSHPLANPGAVALAGNVPVVAIGGITLERARLVRETGAAAGAVIAALPEVPDEVLSERARLLHRALRGER